MDTDRTNEPARADAAELDAFLNRIERLKDEKQIKAREINEAIKEVYGEASAKGYDKKAIDLLLKIRGQDEQDRRVLGFYADVLGVFG